MHNGRRIFQHHYAEGRTNAAVVCDASGWLVEDHELRVVARKTRSDAGIAQPSKAPRRETGHCPRCDGYGMFDGDDCRRCHGHRTRPEPSPVPQENNGRSS